MTDENETHIVKSWQQNVTAWSDAVRGGKIESRRLITDQAILQAIFSEGFATAIDIGCGEGWLVRELQDQNISAVGVDAVSAFIETAQHKRPGDYRCIAYEELAQNGLDQRFDLAICNFSLLGKDSVEALVSGIPRLLNPGGRFIVQTLNPKNVPNEERQDGWRSGSWDGFGEKFVNPAPWYFRTVKSWLALFAGSGLITTRTVEPAYTNGVPASIIFTSRGPQTGLKDSRQSLVQGQTGLAS